MNSYAVCVHLYCGLLCNAAPSVRAKAFLIIMSCMKVCMNSMYKLQKNCTF
jgi:hypothetical protein